MFVLILFAFVPSPAFTSPAIFASRAAMLIEIVLVCIILGLALLVLLSFSMRVWFVIWVCGFGCIALFVAYNSPTPAAPAPIQLSILLSPLRFGCMFVLARFLFINLSLWFFFVFIVCF